jgi:Alpha-2-macroglobulin bait region domain
MNTSKLVDWILSKINSKRNQQRVIQLSICRPLVIGETIDFELQASSEMPSEVYSLVLGPRGILFSETLNPEIEDTSVKFHLKLTKEMVPSSQVLVYFLQSSGEVVFDNIKLIMELPSENNVSKLKNLKIFMKVIRLYDYSWSLSFPRLLLNLAKRQKLSYRANTTRKFIYLVSTKA